VKSAVRFLALILLQSSTLLAAPTANDLAACKEAGARLTAMIETAQRSGGAISQLKSAEVMRLVKIISDEDRILRADAYPVTEMESLLDTCDVANKASVSLMLFNLKTRLDPTANQQQTQAAVIQLASENIAAFQDELEEIQPFLLRCLAKQVQPMVQFIATLKPAELTAVRRQGLAGARTGLLQIYTGALQAANDPRYREDYRLALLGALAETSVHFARILELPARKELRDSMKGAASKSAGAYKLHLTRIADSLNNETCEGLCRIP
jgi:hypothetical protein